MNTRNRLAKGSIKENKSRSILICVAIFLSTMLLTILALASNGIIKYNLESAGELYGTFDGAYVRVTKEQLDEMKLRSEFRNVGYSSSFAGVEVSGVTGLLSYQDPTLMKSSKITFIQGKAPVKENEIAAQKEFFHYLGYENAQIGDTVKVSYRNNFEGEILTSNFVISGFIESSEANNLKKVYGALTSQDFFEKNISVQERSYSVSFNLYNRDELSYDKAIEEMNALAEKMGIEEINVTPNKMYLMWVTDPGTETILPCVGIGAIIVIFSIIVIYNIYYVGIIQKVQEYGKLRALGTTKKQLKSIILREGFYLALPGILGGTIVGIIGTKLFFRYLFHLISTVSMQTEIHDISLFNLPLIIMVVAIAFITVLVSILEPMKIATKVSPVEATRYQENSKKAKKRKGNKEMNIFRITTSNLSVNKKRTITTILTMGLSCVLFVVVANVVGNLNPEYDARNTIEKGDFYISIDAAAQDETYPENNIETVQKTGIMNEDFRKQIQAIDGVTKVETRKIVKAENVSGNVGEDDLYFMIEVLPKDDFTEKAKALCRGKADYEKAAADNGIIYCWDNWMDSVGYEIGKTYDLILYDGDKRIPFSGVLEGSLSDGNCSMIMTEDTYKKLGITGDLTSEIWVSCKEEYEESVAEELEKLTGVSDYLSLERYKDQLKLSKFSVSFVRSPSYALLGLLGVIGFMNLANTLITSIITRKREFGILQAIGMTTKQLNSMLQMEGLLFTVGTLVISLTLGNLFGYYAFCWAKTNGFFGLDTYHFPFEANICMVIALLTLQMILSFVMSRDLQKDTLIERIRYSE